MIQDARDDQGRTEVQVPGPGRSYPAPLVGGPIGGLAGGPIYGLDLPADAKWWTLMCSSLRSSRRLSFAQSTLR